MDIGMRVKMESHLDPEIQKVFEIHENSLGYYRTDTSFSTRYLDTPGSSFNATFRGKPFHWSTPNTRKLERVPI